jgi:hypothetical protein
MSDGNVAFAGTAQDLIERGHDGEPGDSPVERGYSAVLREYREAHR